MIRIYQDLPLKEKTTIILDKKASHHLSQVLRAQVHENIVMFNGQGGEFNSEIVSIQKNKVEIAVKTFVPDNRVSPCDIILAQGIARGEKMDWIIQKAVELGVSTIYPLYTQFGNVHLSREREEKRLAHWRAVAISACEQCGRNQLPNIAAPQKLTEWLRQTDISPGFVLSVQPTKCVSKCLPTKKLSLLIGPEGGLTDEEEALALARGLLPLHLGPRILRTETAAIVAVALMQALLGDLSELFKL